MTATRARGLRGADAVASCVAAPAHQELRRLPGGLVLLHFLPHSRRRWSSRGTGPRSSCQPAVPLPRFQRRIGQRQRSTWAAGAGSLPKPSPSPLSGSCSPPRGSQGGPRAVQPAARAAEPDVGAQRATGEGERGLRSERHPATKRTKSRHCGDGADPEGGRWAK